MRIKKEIPFFAVIFILLCSCSGKVYHSDFFLITEQKPEKIRSGEHRIFSNYQLSENPERQFRSAGTGNLLAATYSRIDLSRVDTALSFIQMSPELGYRLYAELPAEMKPESLDIAGKSLCHLVGRYDSPDYLKIYRCGEGYLVIDTLKSNKAIMRLKGSYYNSAGDSLKFSGRIAAKRE